MKLRERLFDTWRFMPGRQRALLLLLLGALVGMVPYLVWISNFFSYLSDDPRACLNCHVMYPEYTTWRHSSHANDTTCNDCHVPHHSLIAKYRFKVGDGLRHSAVFTLRMEPQVIRARPEAVQVIKDNCIRCHSEQIVHTELADHGRPCLDCHREVPHGRVHSLSSTPNAAVPPLDPVIPRGWMPGSPRQTGGSR